MKNSKSKSCSCSQFDVRFSTGDVYIIAMGAVCVCIVPIAMICPVYYACTTFFCIPDGIGLDGSL